MELNISNIKKFIDGIDEKTASSILHSRYMAFKTKKEIWANKISKKLLIENNKLNDKQCEYYSEILTNMLTLCSNSKNINIIYKPLDSDGYDGTFLIYKNNEYNLYLSETKSSNNQFWSGDQNTRTKKTNEARKDLLKKLNQIYTEDGSSSRLGDNDNIAHEVQLLILKNDCQGISQDNAEMLTRQIDNLINDKKISYGISAALTKEDCEEVKEYEYEDVTFVNTVIILERLEDFTFIAKYLYEKLKRIYE